MSPLRRLGVLECDHVDDRHASIDGDYLDMIQTMLEAPMPEVEVVGYDVCCGVLPTSPHECDGWLCSGSRASVYDDARWIADLTELVRDMRKVASPFVGICFGHQLLAHALGGRTEPAETGWAAGVHRCETTHLEPWMVPEVASPSLLFMHQDQVTELPPGATVLATAPHCASAMLRVDETMLGMQAHPEFSAAYVAALLADREERIGVEKTAAARRSLSEPTDERAVAHWIAQFLTAAFWRY